MSATRSRTASPPRVVACDDLHHAALAYGLNLAALVAALLLFQGLDPADGSGLSPGGRAIAAFHHVGHAFLLWCPPVLLALVAGRLGVPAAAPAALAAIYFALVFGYLYCDVHAFYLMRAHIDPAFLRLALEPGFARDLSLDAGAIGGVAAGLGAVLLLELLLFLPFGPSVVAALRRRFVHPLRLLAVGGVLVSTSWTMFSVQEFTYRPVALQQTATLPLFPPHLAPMRAAGLWRRLGLEPTYAVLDGARLTVRQLDDARETLDYRAFRGARKPPSTLRSALDHDVLVIGAESWRWDTLTPEVMPELTEWARRRGWTAPRHYSTGNSTAEGLFGLFSGLSPLYWYASERHVLPSLPLEILEQLGYRTTVITACDMRYRGIDRYVLGPTVDELITIDALKRDADRREWKQRGLHEEDRRVVDLYLERLDGREPGKHLDVLYFYSTHYNYYYPPERERFTPTLPPDFAIDDLGLRRKRDALHNRYLNAAHYLDHLIGRVLSELEARGRLERTIVVITGDHGEEFFERGRLGHSMSLDDEQTRVPLVLMLPSSPPIHYQVSSHADVAPTVLDALGVNAPLDRWFDGKSLLRHLPERDEALVMSQRRTGLPSEFALVRPGEKLVFVNTPDDMAPVELRRDGDEPWPDPPAARLASARERVLAHKRHFSTDARPR